MPPLTIADIEDALGRRAPEQVLVSETPAHAAVAAIFRQRSAGDGVEVLVIRRTEADGDPWSGHMAFPGGHTEPSDVDQRQAAVRETAEEVGIDLAASGRFLGALDEVRAISRWRGRPLVVTPFAFAVRADIEPSACSAEVAEAVWVPVELLRSGEADSTIPYQHQGQDQAMDFPCFRVEGGVIWGLTYLMLVRLLSRLDEASSTSAGRRP